MSTSFEPPDCALLPPLLLFGYFLPKVFSTATVGPNCAVATNAGTCHRRIAYPIPIKGHCESYPVQNLAPDGLG
jgi:hypothetical protein